MHDPLGFVRFAWPWGRKNSTFAHLNGPCPCQIKFFTILGEEIRKRNFNGRDPVSPIRIAFSSGHGVGKAQPKSLNIDTIDDGLKQWGSIQKGDRLIGGNGAPVSVIAVHEQGIRPIYRIVFDDRSETLCDENHLWNLRGRAHRRNNIDGWLTLSTREIIDRGVKRSNGPVESRQWEIPIQGAAEFPQAKLDIHPYLMGLWLGDGSRGLPQWSKPFPELAERVRSFGYEVHETGKGTNRVQGAARLFQPEAFMRYGHERYIPQEYKFASVEQRKELIRGILDSDGEVFQNGSAGYSSASKQLVEDVIWLARSIGAKAMLQPAVKIPTYTHNGEARQGLPSYRCTINLDWNPFTLEHRKEKWKPTEPRYRSRWIDSIEYSHDEEAMCVTVDREDGLYLTNDFIVTHNSFCAGMFANYVMATRPGSRGTVTANTNTQLQTKTWSAISTMLRGSMHKDLFTLTASRMYENNAYSDWFCAPQTCREENLEAFAGQHAATATSFYLNDETSGLIEAVFPYQDGGMLTGEPMQIMYGNLTKNSGYFYEACCGDLRQKYRQIHIDSRECPLTNKEEIAIMEKEFGEDSDYFRVRVRGLPPHAGDTQFIDLERVREAQQRRVAVLPEEPLIASADFAWGGDDMNVIRFRKGMDMRSIPPIRIPGSETRDHMVLVNRMMSILRMTHGPQGDTVYRLFCDSSGIAAPVSMVLRQRGFDNVIPVNFSGHSPDKRYRNMRVWMYARLRDMLMHAAIGNDSALEDDLTSMGYFTDDSGRLCLEKKEDVKKRTGKSPDDGDALALLFAEDVPIPQKSSYVTRVNQGRRDTAWMI